MNETFGFLWLAWIAMFVIVELSAVLNHKTGDTLSEWVWHIISHPAVYFPFAGFLIWLLLHFLFKVRA